MRKTKPKKKAKTLLSSSGTKSPSKGKKKGLTPKFKGIWDKPKGRGQEPGTKPNPPNSSRPIGLTDEIRTYTREFKEYNSACADCLKDYPPYVLEFDHLDGKTKKFNIGHASSIPSMEALKAEIEKCDVVCSSCHKMREHMRKTQPGWEP